MLWTWVLLFASVAVAAGRGADSSLPPRPEADVTAPPVSALSVPAGAAAPAELAAPLAAGPATADPTPPQAAGAAALDAARRIAVQLTRIAEDAEALDPRALDDLLEIELPFLVQAEASLKLDAGGAIELDRHGFPDRESYFAARKAAALLADPKTGAAVPPAERVALERMAAVYDRTKALLFSGPNELALSRSYQEPSPGGLSMTVMDFIRTERFKTPGAWVWSSQHSREAPHGYASVTADRARSPFLKDLGPGAFTTIYWAALPGDEFGRPDPEGMRVRVNSDAFGNELTLEVMVPIGFEEDGQIRWQGFFFKKIGDEWVPGVPTKLAPTERCIRCHFRLDSDGKPRLTPVPTLLKTKGEFLDVGYRDTALLAAYLRMIGSFASR